MTASRKTPLGALPGFGARMSRLSIFSSMQRVLKRFVAAIFALAAFMSLAAPAVAQFKPNERLISPNPGLIDMEFSQGKSLIAWTDVNGNLWLDSVIPATGAFAHRSGEGTTIATGTISKTNMFLWNGPEWMPSPIGDELAFGYYIAGAPPVAASARLAVAAQNSSGDWIIQKLGPSNAARMFDAASLTPGDPNPQIMYFDPSYNHYYRSVSSAASETLMTFVPAADKAWRFAQGMHAIMYTAKVGGVDQVFRHLTESNTDEQLTFDAGDKDPNHTVPWMFPAPELGNAMVVITFVNGSEFRAYEQLPNSQGILTWMPIYSAPLPPGDQAGSPQYLFYNGKTYVYWVMYVNGADYPSEVWISNIDAAHPLLRKISIDTPDTVRNDPEHYITTSGPLVYFNRYDTSKDPTGSHPLCAACSQGVYAIDPGLGSPIPIK